MNKNQVNKSLVITLSITSDLFDIYEQQRDMLRKTNESRHIISKLGNRF